MTQGYFKVPNSIFDLAEELDAITILVFIALIRYANGNGNSWPRQATLAKNTQLAEETVMRKLQILEQKGFITVRRRLDGKGRAYFIQWLIASQNDESFDIALWGQVSKGPINNPSIDGNIDKAAENANSPKKHDIATFDVSGQKNTESVPERPAYLCQAMNQRGSLCGNEHLPRSNFCTLHIPETEKVLRKAQDAIPCFAKTLNGNPCRNRARNGTQWCAYHSPEEVKQQVSIEREGRQKRYAVKAGVIHNINRWYRK